MAASPVPKPPQLPQPAVMPRSSPWPMLFIVLIFVVLGGVFYLYRWYQSQELLHSVSISTPTITPPAPLTNDSSNDSTSSAEFIASPSAELVFPLQTTDDWQLVTTAQPQLQRQAIVINNQSGFSSEWFIKYASPNGEEYVSTSTITEYDPANISNAQRSSIEQEYLSEFGFTSEIFADGYRITPLSADGPEGGVGGYVRQTPEGIQVYLSSSQMINAQYDDGDGTAPPKLLYPYDVQHRQFLSQPISLEELLDIAQE